MRKTVLILILFALVFSCCRKESVLGKEKCIGNAQEIQKTKKLAVGDSINSFGGYTENDQMYSLDELKGKFLVLYFVRLNRDKEGRIIITSQLNEEVKNDSLRELVKNKNGDILILNSLKIAKIYGVEFERPTNIKQNTLFVADKNKIIRHIYVDVCEDDIVDIVNNLKLQ